MLRPRQWAGSVSAASSEGASAHESANLGVRLHLVEAVALLHLGREAVDVLNRCRLALGDLRPLTIDILGRNTILIGPNLCLYGLTYLPVWRKVDLDPPDCNPLLSLFQIGRLRCGSKWVT